ncbi:hypothetical protein ACFYSH_24750 [Streptomyces sp. NPDC005791]|uniref:hypothetical protein n=1 Tax=Streptomyces sp. NPDC005791 TaxID=3364732 RepID=UPI00368ED81F
MSAQAHAIAANHPPPQPLPDWVPALRDTATGTTPDTFAPKTSGLALITVTHLHKRNIHSGGGVRKITHPFTLTRFRIRRTDAYSAPLKAPFGALTRHHRRLGALVETVPLRRRPYRWRERRTDINDPVPEGTVR